MSAEALGKVVLQDVHTESLAELLLTVRHFRSQSRPQTGTEILDKIINSYPSSNTNDTHTTPHGFQLGYNDVLHTTHDFDNQYSDEISAHNLEHIPPTVPIKPILLNISLARPGHRTAATRFLNHLVAFASLTNTLGGKQGCVVWIDLSNNFSAKSLHHHILKYLASKHLAKQPNLDLDSNPVQDRPEDTDVSADLAELSKQALHHVHVISCTSTQQLLQTLRNLPSYLFDLAENQSIDRPCTLLVIDSINQFYWVDQFDAEIARLERPASTSRVTSEGNFTSSILNELKDLSTQLECAVVYTSQPTDTGSSVSRYVTSRAFSGPETPGSTSPPVPSDSSTKFDPFHASALLTLNPVLAATNVPQFGTQMTLDECVRYQEKRSEAIRDGCTRWWFDVKGGGTAAAAHRGEKTGFWMRVDGIGVKFE